MSYPTWTAEELESNIIHLNGSCWRFVESQHVVSTMKIVDTRDEQDRLESLLDETKPAIPEHCKNLDYLLFTPFRYKPTRHGSRFRREGQSEGAFYASEKIETALAEISFLKLLTFAESPETPLPSNPFNFTALKVKYKSDRSIDLTNPPLNCDSEAWENPNDYVACQNIADQARKAKITIIKSNSVRCPQKGKNITILFCDAFAENKPTDCGTWKLTIKDDRIIAFKGLSSQILSFTLDDFNNDPRIIRKA